MTARQNVVKFQTSFSVFRWATMMNEYDEVSQSYPQVPFDMQTKDSSQTESASSLVQGCPNDSNLAHEDTPIDMRNTDTMMAVFMAALFSMFHFAHFSLDPVGCDNLRFNHTN
jgi:hypothetical protein